MNIILPKGKIIETKFCQILCPQIIDGPSLIALLSVVIMALISKLIQSVINFKLDTLIMRVQRGIVADHLIPGAHTYYVLCR